MKYCKGKNSLFIEYKKYFAEIGASDEKKGIDQMWLHFVVIINRIWRRVSER